MFDKLKMLCALVVLAIGGSFSTVHAQGFIRAVKDQGQIANNLTFVETPDGQEHTGKVDGCTFSMGALKSLTIKDDAGNKTKYAAADVTGIRVKVDTLMKLDLVMGDGTIVGSATNDYNETATRDYVIYERVLMPGKKDKQRLLQIVNPGFDQRLKIYYNPNPNANTSGGFMGITAVTPDTYLVVKDGARAIKVKKGDYRKQFEELYGDCPSMGEIYAKKKERDWDYFPEHAFIYDQQCK